MPSQPTDYAPARGGRSRSRRGRSNRGPRRDREETPVAPPKPLTLWERVVAFFTGSNPEPAGASSTRPPSARPARVEVARPPRDTKPSVRKPELVDVTTPRIYVGNLSFDATESDLSELFSGVGSVQHVELVCHRDTERSKGFAFVQLQTIDEAKRAVAELHDQLYMGRKLVVSGAKAQPETRSERRASEEE